MPNQFLSRIENLPIHDASAIHDISANDRDYTVTVGNPLSVYKKEIQVDIPKDVNTILDNLTTNLILKETVEEYDVSIYSRVEVDTKIDSISAKQTLTDILVGEVAEYDPYVTYNLDSYAKKDNYIWKCVVSQTYGPWDPLCWRRTSLYEEIIDLKGVETTIEKVSVHVGINYGDGVVTGSTLSLIFDSATGKPTQTVTLDSTGRAVFFVNYGDQYFLECSNTIPGYNPPQSRTYTAGLPTRNDYAL